MNLNGRWEMAEEPLPSSASRRCGETPASSAAVGSADMLGSVQPGSSPREMCVHRGQFAACAMTRGWRMDVPQNRWFPCLSKWGTAWGGTWRALTRGQGAQATWAPRVLTPIPTAKSVKYL